MRSTATAARRAATGACAPALPALPEILAPGPEAVHATGRTGHRWLGGLQP
ncbi:hypothetical protein [Pseudoduganella albidiflava]|uniref:hypothetical protein n=1 Tax=Pseudoduganella albidiflava TaxID=321983 RepID=UPI0013F166EF|nr:hypothetical protein [Pseudoduganella albidiflava]